MQLPDLQEDQSLQASCYLHLWSPCALQGQDGLKKRAWASSLLTLEKDTDEQQEEVRSTRGPGCRPPGEHQPSAVRAWHTFNLGAVGRKASGTGESTFSGMCFNNTTQMLVQQVSSMKHEWKHNMKSDLFITAAALNSFKINTFPSPAACMTGGHCTDSAVRTQDLKPHPISAQAGRQGQQQAGYHPSRQTRSSRTYTRFFQRPGVRLFNVPFSGNWP